MLKQASRVVVAIACSVTLLALTGCTQPDPIYARSDGAQVQFLVCDAIVAEEIRIEGAVEGKLGFEVIWIASGRVDVEPGLIVTYPSPPVGMTTTTEPTLASLAGYSVVFAIGDPLGDAAVYPEDASILSSGFVISKLDSTLWTDRGGNRYENPC